MDAFFSENRFISDDVFQVFPGSIMQCAGKEGFFMSQIFGPSSTPESSEPLFGPTNLKTWPINILPYDNEKWHVHVCIYIIYKYSFFKMSGNIFTLHFLYDAILKIQMYVYIYINANKHTHTHAHTLDKKWIIEVILGKWIPSHAIRLDLYIYMGYGGHQLRLKCTQVQHHNPAGTFTRVPGRCLCWSPTLPRDPGDPLC